MRPLARLFLFASFTLSAASAHAQLEDTPGKSPAMTTPPPRAAAVPDAAWQAMLHRNITVRMSGGREVTGELIATDAEVATLIVAVTREVVVVPKAEVTALLAAALPIEPTAARPPVPQQGLTDEPAPPPGPEKRRTVGLQFSMTPGVMVDFEYRLAYAFVNASLLPPITTGGEWLAYSIGAGVTLMPGVTSRWHLDLFALATPARINQSNLAAGLGVGVGAHYTGRNGFTIGFKVPLLGYGVGKGAGSGTDAAEFFYLSAALGLPLVSLGYRF